MKTMIGLLLLSGAAHAVDCGQAITRPGTYTLSRNCTGGITVQSNGVSLNLAGRTLTCGSNPYGVLAPGVSRLRLYGGKITNCVIGLHASGASRVLVDSVDFTGNRYIGVNLGGSRNTVRNSTFTNITGYAASGYAVGVNVSGPNCSITRNTFRNLEKQSSATGEGVGILIRSGGCTIQHNWVENDAPGMNIGVWVSSHASAAIRENVITNFGRAIVGAPGSEIYAVDNRIMLKSPVAESYGIAGEGLSSGNLISGFDHPAEGVVSAGDVP